MDRVLDSYYQAGLFRLAWRTMSSRKLEEQATGMVVTSYDTGAVIKFLLKKKEVGCWVFACVCISFLLS